jgi:hypothetical protein
MLIFAQVEMALQGNETLRYSAASLGICERLSGTVSKSHQLGASPRVAEFEISQCCRNSGPESFNQPGKNTDSGTLDVLTQLAGAVSHDISRTAPANRSGGGDGQGWRARPYHEPPSRWPDSALQCNAFETTLRVERTVLRTPRPTL